jgi:hypothetical protein
MEMLVWRKNFEDRKCPPPAAPDLEFVLLSGALTNFLCKTIRKIFALEPRTGTKGQLHSQDKLAMPRRENWKIQYEIVILKANEHEYVYKLEIYRMTPKNIAQNLMRI